MNGPAPERGTLTGIVTGLRAEARLLRRSPLLACAGSEPEVAARAMVAAGATRLLSFGLAGGLDPTLTPGTVILATEVISGGDRLPTDEAWRQGIARPAMIQAPLLGAGEPLARSDAKLAAGAVTGAVAVDMESGAVARVAREAGLPFLALRAIADPAWRDLPPAVLRIIDGQGRIRLRAAALALALHPCPWPCWPPICGRPWRPCAASLPC
ncbi:MAG: purine phosphorylase [Magnetospirillum sp.]|nr:purine phosphorylase [Magnetospirillum sp.]